MGEMKSKQKSRFQCNIANIHYHLRASQILFDKQDHRTCSNDALMKAGAKFPGDLATSGAGYSSSTSKLQNFEYFAIFYALSPTIETFF